MLTVDRSPADTPHRYAVGDLMPDQAVMLADGQPVTLSDLWRDQPLVLTFLRHLGCIFCREAVARLATIRPTLVELGASVAVVTLGTPDQASSFCRQRAPGLICLADPAGNLYRSVDLGRVALSNLAGLQTVRAGLRATMAGHRQGRSVGDVGWMPGAFIIDRTGRIAYAHYARHAGDHAPEAEIIAAVRALHRLPSPPVGMAAHTED